MWTKRFWTDTAERALRSAAQTAILAIGAGEAFNLFHLNVASFSGLVLGGVALSVLNAIVAAPFGDAESASFRREE